MSLPDETQSSCDTNNYKKVKGISKSFYSDETTKMRSSILSIAAVRQQEGWTRVAVSGKERIWQDGGQRPIDRYRHLETYEQVVGSKEPIDLSGKERMKARWCSLVMNKWKLVLKNGLADVT